jgi:hypothetical protein
MGWRSRLWRWPPGACTSGLPLPVSALTTGAVTTSWSTAQPGTGAYDVAYDIWFNQSPATSGQPNGAEVMIWLNHNGSVQPFGSQAGTASIGGHSYNVWSGNQGWNTISYTMTTGTTSVSNLDIDQVVADAVSRGYISRSWYLLGVVHGHRQLARRLPEPGDAEEHQPLTGQRLETRLGVPW